MENGEILLYYKQKQKPRPKMENIVKEYYKLRYKKYGGRTEYMRLIGGDCDEIYRTIGYAMEDIHAGDRIDIDPVTGECRRQRGNVGGKKC